MGQIGVALLATNPLGLTGLAALLRPYTDIRILSVSEYSQADVAVVRCNRFTPRVVSRLRQAPFHGRTSVVLLVNQITEAELLMALDCRVVEIIAASAATEERVRHSVTSAAGRGGHMPDGLVEELLKHIDRVQQEILTPAGGHAGLSRREVDVLRLMADGLSTSEIADQMSYSERTVKNVIHDITHRHRLRNRSHAVAFALRAGII